MATLLTAVSLLPTVDGTQQNSAENQTAGLVAVDKDQDLAAAAEVGGYDNFVKVFRLSGLTKGQAVGLDWGTLVEATNSFTGNFNLELRPV